MKTHIYSQQSDRKSRLATKKSLHNESMEDPNVKNYIYNLPIPGLTAWSIITIIPTFCINPLLSIYKYLDDELI